MHALNGKIRYRSFLEKWHYHCNGSFQCPFHQRNIEDTVALKHSGCYPKTKKFSAHEKSDHFMPLGQAFVEKLSRSLKVLK